MTDVAVREVRALAAELGVTDEPVLVADRSNLVLALGDLIARVAMATSAVRVGVAWLRREVEIARFLGRLGGEVTRPSARLDPGPHERAGLVISFWEREEIVADQPDPREAGARLRELHRHLAGYPRAALPLWGGFEEAREVMKRARTSALLEPSEIARLDRAWELAERVVEGTPARTASMQAIHGDAHIGNVLATSRGAVWTDWEDAFIGPVEYDIACLRSRAELFGEDQEAIDAMTGAYGPAYDADLARELGLVRNVQVIPWLAVFAERHPDLATRMRARIAKLP